jgi:hypothetical protein
MHRSIDVIVFGYPPTRAAWTEETKKNNLLNQKLQVKFSPPTLLGVSRTQRAVRQKTNGKFFLGASSGRLSLFPMSLSKYLRMGKLLFKAYPNIDVAWLCSGIEELRYGELSVIHRSN